MEASNPSMVSRLWSRGKGALGLVGAGCVLESAEQSENLCDGDGCFRPKWYQRGRRFALIDYSLKPQPSASKDVVSGSRNKSAVYSSKGLSNRALKAGGGN